MKIHYLKNKKTNNSLSLPRWLEEINHLRQKIFVPYSPNILWNLYEKFRSWVFPSKEYSYYKTTKLYLNRYIPFVNEVKDYLDYFEGEYKKYIINPVEQASFKMMLVYMNNVINNLITISNQADDPYLKILENDRKFLVLNCLKSAVILSYNLIKMIQSIESFTKEAEKISEDLNIIMAFSEGFMNQLPAMMRRLHCEYQTTRIAETAAQNIAHALLPQLHLYTIKEIEEIGSQSLLMIEHYWKSQPGFALEESSFIHGFLKGIRMPRLTKNPQENLCESQEIKMSTLFSHPYVQNLNIETMKPKPELQEQKKQLITKMQYFTKAMHHLGYSIKNDHNLAKGVLSENPYIAMLAPKLAELRGNIKAVSEQFSLLLETENLQPPRRTSLKSTYLEGEGSKKQHFTLWQTIKSLFTRSQKNQHSEIILDLVTEKPPILVSPASLEMDKPSVGDARKKAARSYRELINAEVHNLPVSFTIEIL